jgi:hypothetical protein
VFVVAARDAFEGAARDLRMTFLIIVLAAAATVLTSVVGAAGTWAVLKVRSRRRAAMEAEPEEPEPVPAEVALEAPGFAHSQPAP